MTFSLFDATIGTYKQILPSVSNVLAKGRTHLESDDGALEAMIGERLIDDMLPFSFQVVSVAHHSVNALRGVQEGVFGPPSMGDLDYAGLENLVSDALAGVNEYTEDTVNGFIGQPVEFKMGAVSVPFKAEDFLLTFSLPNFYFHATTTYDLLRGKGVELGKRDFLGQMRINM